MFIASNETRERNLDTICDFFAGEAFGFSTRALSDVRAILNTCSDEKIAEVAQNAKKIEKS